VVEAVDTSCTIVHQQYGPTLSQTHHPPKQGREHHRWFFSHLSCPHDSCTCDLAWVRIPMSITIFMATATLPLVFQVTEGNSTHHKPLSHSKCETATLPLAFRVTEGNSTHHRPLACSKCDTEGFHSNGNPPTRVSSGRGEFLPPQTPPSLKTRDGDTYHHPPTLVHSNGPTA
jgi:hypothetical protein